MEEATDLLREPRRWVVLQPLVTAVEEETPEHYRVRERVPVLGVPVRNSYRCRITPHEDWIDSETWAWPAIRLTNTIRWAPHPERADAIELIETVQLTAPRVLLRFVVRTAKRAHVEMLERIAARLEGRA